MPPLTAKKRSALRAEAHKLSPVVIIGDRGLTDEVVAEIDRSLKAHELIKVRAATSEREARDAWLEAICERLQAHPVQQIGKVFVLFRENPEEPAPRRAPPAKRPPTRGGSKVSREANQRQRARDDEKRRAFDIRDMVRKGKIPATAKLAPGPKPAPGPSPRGGGRDGDEAKRTSRPRSRTPSPPPESGPRRRRPRTSR